MTTLDFKLPLAIRRAGESISVVDAVGKVLLCSYYEDEARRRNLTHRVTRAEAEEIANVFARAVTERLKRGD